MEVKIKAGWVCEDCGELDIRLFESHHIKPKSKFPDLIYDIYNGKCVCLRCHAKYHPKLKSLILAKLESILNAPKEEEKENRPPDKVQQTVLPAVNKFL